MATRLYVGNLSYQTTDQELQDLFSEIGNVASVQVMIDRQTGQSRGFGFVEMATEDEAQQAIAAINGRTFGGRALRVNESRPREERGGGFGYSRGQGQYGGGSGGYGGRDNYGNRDGYDGRESYGGNRDNYSGGDNNGSGRESYSGGGGRREGYGGNRRGRDDVGGNDRW